MAFNGFREAALAASLSQVQEDLCVRRTEISRLRKNLDAAESDLIGLKLQEDKLREDLAKAELARRG